MRKDLILRHQSGSAESDMQISRQPLALKGRMPRSASRWKNGKSRSDSGPKLQCFCQLLSTAFDWLFAKAQPPEAFKWMPFMGAAWGTTVHLKGGIQWYNRCW